METGAEPHSAKQLESGEPRSDRSDDSGQCGGNFLDGVPENDLKSEFDEDIETINLGMANTSPSIVGKLPDMSTFSPSSNLTGSKGSPNLRSPGTGTPESSSQHSPGNRAFVELKNSFHEQELASLENEAKEMANMSSTSSHDASFTTTQSFNKSALSSAENKINQSVAMTNVMAMQSNSAASNRLAVSHSDNFYQNSASVTDFPSGDNGRFQRGPAMGEGFGVMDNYSPPVPGDPRAGRTSKNNLLTNFPHPHMPASKSNQVPFVDKFCSLEAQDKQYSFGMVGGGGRPDTRYKTAGFTQHFPYSAGFDMNSNTYSHARSYGSYNNALHGDNVNLQGPISSEGFASENPQLKPASFSTGQLNVYQNGFYHGSNYGSSFNGSVNRTMSNALFSQQNYLNSSPSTHVSNMAEGNGGFEQLGAVDGPINTPHNEYPNVFNEYYNFNTQHGFQT